jgi:hypothetical protein
MRRPHQHLAPRPNGRVERSSRRSAGRVGRKPGVCAWIVTVPPWRRREPAGRCCRSRPRTIICAPVQIAVCKLRPVGALGRDALLEGRCSRPRRAFAAADRGESEERCTRREPSRPVEGHGAPVRSVRRCHTPNAARCKAETQRFSNVQPVSIVSFAVARRLARSDFASFEGRHARARHRLWRPGLGLELVRLLEVREERVGHGVRVLRHHRERGAVVADTRHDGLVRQLVRLPAGGAEQVLLGRLSVPYRATRPPRRP